MIKLTNLKIPAAMGENALWSTAEKISGARDVKNRRILKKSVDARKKNDVNLIYTVCFSAENEKQVLKSCKAASDYVPKKEYEFPGRLEKVNRKPVVVVGMGPAGLFAALTLSRAGHKRRANSFCVQNLCGVRRASGYRISCQAPHRDGCSEKCSGKYAPGYYSPWR